MKENYHSEFLEEYGYIFVKMTGFLNHEDYINCWTDVLRLISRHQVNKLLVDMSESKIISEPNLKWLHETYFPRAYQIFSSYRVARLTSPDLFNQFSINKLDKDRNKSNYSEVSKDFSNIESAKTWLLGNAV
jgi:hypothetical protein